MPEECAQFGGHGPGRRGGHGGPRGRHMSEDPCAARPGLCWEKGLWGAGVGIRSPTRCGGREVNPSPDQRLSTTFPPRCSRGGHHSLLAAWTKMFLLGLDILYSVLKRSVLTGGFQGRTKPVNPFSLLKLSFSWPSDFILIHSTWGGKGKVIKTGGFVGWCVASWHRLRWHCDPLWVCCALCGLQTRQCKWESPAGSRTGIPVGLLGNPLET